MTTWEVDAPTVASTSKALGDGRNEMSALAFADRFGDHCGRIEQVTQFGSTRRTTPLHTELAREGLRRTGRSVVELYQSDFALDRGGETAR